MTSPGRPTDYRPTYDELAYNYCLLGATNEELAGFLGVTGRTIGNWITAHESFAISVHDGRALADAKVARSLYVRALGYDRTVKRTTEHGGETTTVTTEMHYPPHAQACIFWLRNRRRQTWRETVADGAPNIAAEMEALQAAGEAALVAGGEARNVDGG
jgi:hypothetical protein